MGRKIAIIGPECSGKTTLAQAIAAHYGAVPVPEMARIFPPVVGRRYTEPDLLLLAHEQVKAEQQGASRNGDLVVCDTDILTICIWSEEVFGNVDPMLIELLRNTPYDHRFLCTPEMPWEADPLRENPFDRDRLFAVYERWLERFDLPYTIISGPLDHRLKVVRSELNTPGSKQNS